MTLTGRSIVASPPVETRALSEGTAFTAINPATGQALTPEFISATGTDIDRATLAAEEAFSDYGNLSGSAKAQLLRNIAAGLDAERQTLIERANLETALPPPRLDYEINRTANQLRMFAGVLEEGSWVNARIERAIPSRMPTPRPDHRSMLRPLGPVVVFGASNFPFAYSVAGGDTASALAAGNPVIVKAHPAHPGTSELVGQIVASAVRQANLPGGVFSLLFDNGIDVGVALVRHPRIKAVGFTGSLAGGRALMDIAASRPEPIPCFAEMGSTNPVFLLPGALLERGEQIANGLYGSITGGAGQFCTKPGLVFLPRRQSDEMYRKMRQFVSGTAPFTMLTRGIAAQFSESITKRREIPGVHTVAITASAGKAGGFTTSAALLAADTEVLAANPGLVDEIFGPTSLLVSYGDRKEILGAAEALHGHLTASVFGTEEDLAENRDLIAILERKAGRIVFNGYPTGVEVSHAIVHGGPYPATSDGRSTSVGSQAIFRFARLVCYQNFPDRALPEELQNSNPRGILRMIDGVATRDAVA